MAITALEFMVLASFREHQVLPKNPRVLELGESNWYGDVTIEQFEQEIRRLATDPADRDRHLFQLNKTLAANGPALLYELAQIFLNAVVQAGEYSAIDPGTPGSKYRFDLNYPVPIDEQFDLTLNIGTAEHIFNVYQFFKTAHDRTATGGLMMHSSPFNGWLDHGFFNFQPTFYFDLARQNGYEILSFIVGKLKPFEYVQVKSHDEIRQLIQAGKVPAGSHINVVYRKTRPDEFSVPMQAYYAGALSKESQRAWHEMR
jgi:hypothetical protein